MRYWLDEEFIDDASIIDLISIGIVAEDGRELYLQSSEFKAKKASPWVWENVLSHLEICPHVPAYGPIEDHLPKELRAHKRGQCIDQQRGLLHNCPWRSRDAIRREILSFMDVGAYGKPEIWTYYGCYDHVVFCQLFGTMMDLPKGFPMYTRDIKMWCNLLGDPRLPEQGKGEHNALADAKWNKRAWEFLNELALKRAS